jgi:hypothetical protein
MNAVHQRQCSGNKLEMNMMNSKPAVPNNSKLESRLRKFKPNGPMIIPAMIKPIREGTFILLNRIGTVRMIFLRAFFSPLTFLSAQSGLLRFIQAHFSSFR